MKLILLLLAVSAIVVAKDPPIYDYAYSISFDETVVDSKTSYKVSGKLFYDPTNNRERVDRSNGRYNSFCGSVLPNVTTSCQQYTVNNRRWIVFPQKNTCCFCCDSAHGCGIVKPNWLNGSDYKGASKLADGNIYDEWSKDGDVGYNLFWATTNEDQIPRRLDANGKDIVDFNTYSFENQTIPFPDSVFALPSSCNPEKINNCPLQSVCGQLRQSEDNLRLDEDEMEEMEEMWTALE
jgi:hypothetical protein